MTPGMEGIGTLGYPKYCECCGQKLPFPDRNDKQKIVDDIELVEAAQKLVDAIKIFIKKAPRN